MNTLPGKIIAEGNLQPLHFVSIGKGVTAILTSGFGSPCSYTDFYPLMNELKLFMQVNVYDRAGYGWSPKGTFPVKIDKTVDNLHQLLMSAHVKTPYVLIAHSVGSLEMLHFASKYPQLTKAIVLLDGISPQSYENFDEAKSLKILKMIKANKWLFKLAVNLNLFSDMNERVKFLPEDIVNLDKKMIIKNFANETMIEMTRTVKQDAETVRKNISIDEVPLLVVTAKQTLTDKRFDFTNWAADQEYLCSLSKKSKQVILDTNHTTIMMDKVKEIAAEIKLLLNES